MKPIFKHFKEFIANPDSVDFHIHTTFTDGSSTIQEYVNRAILLDIQEIAFTEHVRKTSPWYHSFVASVESVRESYKNKIRIYHGIETKVLNLNGDMDASDEMLKTAELVLGSVHRFPDSLIDDSPYGNQFSPDDLAEIEFKLASAILKNPRIDVLAHPGGMFSRRFNKKFPEKFVKKLIVLANQYHKAIEINSSYLQDIEFDSDLFFQLNPRISLGSDAHTSEDLGTIVKFIKNI